MYQRLRRPIRFEPCRIDCAVSRLGISRLLQLVSVCFCCGLCVPRPCCNISYSNVPVLCMFPLKTYYYFSVIRTVSIWLEPSLQGSAYLAKYSAKYSAKRQQKTRLSARAFYADLNRYFRPFVLRREPLFRWKMGMGEHRALSERLTPTLLH